MHPIRRVILKVPYLKKWFQLRNGQITSAHEVGRWIRVLSSLAEVENIVEIGTWSGQGSSKLISLGILDCPKRNFKSAIGLELDSQMWKIAKRNLRKYHFFEVLHGRIVDFKDLDAANLSNDELEWFSKDATNFDYAPNVLEKIPSKIDLLVLDGGEFSTFAEFITLKSKIDKWVVLDDTKIRKNFKVKSLLLQDDNFNLIWESDERNGCAIFKKTKLSN